MRITSFILIPAVFLTFVLSSFTAVAQVPDHIDWYG